MSVNKSGLNEFFSKIYMWMFVGLMISAVFAYFTLSTPLGVFIFSNKALYYGIIAIELAILFGVQLLINKLSVKASYFLYFLYAAVNGITLSWIFLMYQVSSLVLIFVVSAVLFLTLAVVGFMTKRDLTTFGSFMMIGMWGVFVSSLVNMFLQNSFFDMIVSGVAVLVFSGLTVYDNQAYKRIYAQSDSKNLGRYVVLGALHMYINFIMIFVNLLKLFGSRN